MYTTILSGEIPRGVVAETHLGRSKMIYGAIDAHFVARGVITQDTHSIGLILEGSQSNMLGRAVQPGDKIGRAHV